jgi:hypothetical protein
MNLIKELLDRYQYWKQKRQDNKYNEKCWKMYVDSCIEDLEEEAKA